jgi:chorismate synthase
MARDAEFRDLRSLEDLAAVVELERRVWGPGYDDVVPLPVLAVSVRRGGILIGAFDGGRLVGFVYSLPAIVNGRATEWSHMLGVLEAYRGVGVGPKLKALQRERALDLGIDLIEWTFDPMQAVNAHLNFAKLGVVVEEYEINVYGNSESPLHKGNPTDRFVAQWWIRDRRVITRLGGSVPVAPVLPVEPVNGVRAAGGWLVPSDVDLSIDARRIAVEIPTCFTDMLAGAPDVALEWRMASRELFTTYFARGYRAVDFFFARGQRTGTFLLVQDHAARP